MGKSEHPTEQTPDEVNLEYIVELRAVAHGEYEVVLRSGRALRVTRRFRDVLQDRLRELA